MGWFVSLYSIHYVLCNADDKTDKERRKDRQTDIQQKPDSAGVLTQVQFSVYSVGA